MIAKDDEQVALDTDTIDDILYSIRSNDKEDLAECLKAAAEKYSTTEQRVLLASVAEVSQNTALHYAAANGHDALLSHVLQLLDLPPQSEFVNKRNSAGNTALHWASLNGHLGTTRLLVAAGADLWTRNQAGNLAVFEAERAGKDDVVAYLLQEGATGKETDVNEGSTLTTEDVAEEMSVDGVDSTTEDMASASLNG